MGQVTAMLLAGILSVPRVGRSAMRWRSLGSAVANWLGFSAGAMPDILPSRKHVGGCLLARPAGTIGGRSNTVSSGPLAW